ncbi:hypothetical protein [Actinomadura keratinilytica]
MRARIAVVLAGAVAVTGFTAPAATAAQDAAASTVERAAAPPSARR